jgi:predicted ArsR family transcriptional regulator
MNFDNLITNDRRRKIFAAVMSQPGPFTIKQILSSVPNEGFNYYMVRELLQALTYRGFLTEESIRTNKSKGGRPTTLYILSKASR